MTHNPRAGDEHYHDPQEDVHEARTPTDDQAAVIAILGFPAAPGLPVRLSLAWWERVDRLVAWEQGRAA